MRTTICAASTWLLAVWLLAGLVGLVILAGTGILSTGGAGLVPGLIFEGIEGGNQPWVRWAEVFET